MTRLLALLLPLAAMAEPHLARVAPLGGQAATTVEVEFQGKDLDGVTAVQFDTPQLAWLATTANSATSLKGRVRISATAALGPHRVRLITRNGPTNSRLFNVHEFPGVTETEPRQSIALTPQVVHGYLQGLADQDFYDFTAKAGERWLFDLQSIERGGFLEASLTIRDADGNEVAHNEDQDEYLETPRLAVVFPRTGKYTLVVDQYRGPQGVTCGDNCGYQLQISRLPVVSSIFPLGTRPGATYRVRVSGEALEHTTGAYLQRARGAEHYRLTFPYSMPVDGADTGLTRIDAVRTRAAADAVEAEFRIPASAKPGLWRLWLLTKDGTAEAMALEIDNDANAIDGVLDKPHRYPVTLHANRPFHAWTLAAQLGLPAIDTVLELWSADGKLLAEHDDLMSGQGTVIGNPDSSLHYLPARDESATLVVRDRTDRTGPSFAYRLHIGEDPPGFQLLFEPEEISARAGEEVSVEALLIKQPGFEKAVDVWIEGHAEARGQFRADMHFGPSGDGDNINIPAVHLKVRIPPGTPAGDYPIRLRAQAADKSGPVVDALATLWIGPQGKRNDTRRPLPRPAIYVRN
jgi:hypothetical protein